MKVIGNKVWIIVLVLTIGYVNFLAARNDTIQYPKINKGYIKSYFYDSERFIISPVHWDGTQWIECGVVTGAGLLAYTQDETVRKYFVGHQTVTGNRLSKYVFEPFGNGKMTSVIIGGLYIGGRLMKDERLAGTSLTAAKAFIVSSLGTQVMKQLAHRHRPFQDSIPNHAIWDGPLSNIKYTSFPSGHSTAAFSLATVFALEYRSTVWVPVLAYTLATGTAVSRLYNNKHWTSDVLIGSAIGIITGRFMWKQCKKANNSLTILPTTDMHSASVILLLSLKAKNR